MATKKAADLDKDVQALMELQEKLSMQAGLGQMVRRLAAVFARSRFGAVSCLHLPHCSLPVCAASTADAKPDTKDKDAAAPHRASTLTAVRPAR
jgi:hypothetical protein